MRVSATQVSIITRQLAESSIPGNDLQFQGLRQCLVGSLTGAVAS